MKADEKQSLTLAACTAALAFGAGTFVAFTNSEPIGWIGLACLVIAGLFAWEAAYWRAWDQHWDRGY